MYFGHLSGPGISQYDVVFFAHCPRCVVKTVSQYITHHLVSPQ